MAIKTTTEQLEAVQTAIAQVEAGQSWSMAGVTYSRANLDVLYKREERLLARYAAEQGTRPVCSWAFRAGSGNTPDMECLP